MTEAPRMHPLTLRFSPPAWEEAFQAEFLRASLRPLRVALVFMLAMVSVWGGAFAFLQPERLSGWWVLADLLAWGVATALVLAWSYRPSFRAAMQPAIVVLLCVGFGFSLLNLLVRPDLPDSGASVMALAVGVAVAGLHFVRLTLAYAAPTVAVLVAAAVVGALGAGVLREPEAVFQLVVVAVMAGIAGYASERHNRRAFVATRLLDAERGRSERLLLNVLPAPIAERLKAGENPIADGYDEATVLFADIVDFTAVSATARADEVVETLNALFSEIDVLTEKHGLEKIKTIGDCYMAVAGLPAPRPDHAAAAAELALEIQATAWRRLGPTGQPLRLRIGLNTGPVVAGVIGTKKFIYDLWGDAVNTASRMESHGVPDAIQVTEATYARLKDDYRLEKRGLVDVKGKGLMPTYLLLGRRLAAGPGGDDRGPERRGSGAPVSSDG